MDMFSGDIVKDVVLTRSRLFGNIECWTIDQMRDYYEKKIRRKEKPTFLRYIEEEKKILKKILDNNQSHSSEDNELLEQEILRIIRIYKITLTHFKDDLKIWLSYIKFCIEVGKVDLVTKLFPLMLKEHTEKRLWHLAAKWELSQCNNIDKALNYLYRGLQFNPTAPCLYTHIFRLVLSVGDKQKLESNDDIIEIQKNAEIKALDLFEIATKSIKEYDLYIELLKIATGFKFTNKLQSQISKYLLSSYSNEMKVWHTLAQRELEGHHINSENNHEFIMDTDERYEYCIEKYEQAIVKVPTDKMWEKYLNTLVDLYECSDTVFIKHKFMNACKKAHENHFMTEKHYIVWIECLNNSPHLTDILRSITKYNPKYLQVWMARIKHHFNKTEDGIVESIFVEATKALGENSLPIWKRRIELYQLKGESTSKIEYIFREGLRESDKISFGLQPLFLEWVALFRSRDVLHEIFKELSKRKPACFEMCQKMAELEAMCSNPSEEIFEIIKTIVDENPSIQNDWNDYVCQEIDCGPAWRKEVYNNHLTPKR